MRRDYFSVEIRNTDPGDTEGEETGNPRQPTIDIAFDGPSAALDDRLAGARDDLPSSTIDVAYRLLESAKESDSEGVIGVTDRHTGDFLLEVNVGVEAVLEFVRAAREYGKQTNGTDRYQVRVTREDTEIIRHDKSTFLVYNEEGNLARRHSLIPSGVEL